MSFLILHTHSKLSKILTIALNQRLSTAVHEEKIFNWRSMALVLCCTEDNTVRFLIFRYLKTKKKVFTLVSTKKLHMFCIVVHIKRIDNSCSKPKVTKLWLEKSTFPAHQTWERIIFKLLLGYSLLCSRQRGQVVRTPGS